MARENKNSVPILVAGNKVDLERKRNVMKADVKNASAAMGFSHFEISVALNHDVDDLLIGLLAEIQELYNPELIAQKVHL